VCAAMNNERAANIDPKDPLAGEFGGEGVFGDRAGATARSIGLCVSSRSPADAWAPETCAYLQRKEAKGNARMEAMRCLERHLARRYYRLLSGRSRHRIERQVYPGVP
jgi:hypothetical protein